MKAEGKATARARQYFEDKARSLMAQGYTITPELSQEITRWSQNRACKEILQELNALYPRTAKKSDEYRMSSEEKIQKLLDMQDRSQ